MTKSRPSLLTRARRALLTGIDAARIAFSYQAVESSPTRRPLTSSSRSEDGELPAWKRQILISEAREQLRNFSIAGFALRKHLQFVSYYRFFADTPNREFNRALERRVADWKRRENCDAAGRSDFDELITIIESHRATDGDVGILRLSNGRVQIVEADRIKNPADFGESMSSDWVQGVHVNRIGAPLEFQVWSRQPNGLMAPERRVSARWFDLLAYRTRRDQIRGVSLFAPAVRALSYLSDSLDFALSKQKLEQMLGLVTTLDDGGNLAGVKQTDPNEIDRQLKEAFGHDLLHIALKAGEDARFMESNNPSANFQAFVELVIRLIFSAFDLPYSFFDGSKTNFYGSKGEFEQYLDTVEKKQQPTRAMLDSWLFDWLLPNWLTDPSDPLYDAWPSGWRLSDLRGSVGWRGSGLPLWRLFEYVKETQSAINAGLVDPYALADSFGESLTRNIEKIGDARRLGEEFGVWLPFGREQAINTGL